MREVITFTRCRIALENLIAKMENGSTEHRICQRGLLPIDAVLK